MLVATPVATDTRVLREASTLVTAGHTVHVVGRAVPEAFVPPTGVSVSSVGMSSALRRDGAARPRRRQPTPVRLARWLLLPEHRRHAFGRWAAGAADDAHRRAFDVVHAHDFTALAAGAALADGRGVPLVYDAHELWTGRPREHRPTPWHDRRERRLEQVLGDRADAVLTVGDGVAEALRRRYGWGHVTVVRNTFPAATTPPTPPESPTGLVYPGRLAAYRELETVAQATRDPGLPLPVTLVGPADETWLAGFDPGRAAVRGPVGTDELTDLLTRTGLALVTHSDRWENHRLALPNKLFHAVRAGVPVVATDVGELARVVRRHDLGTLYRPGDAEDLARAVREALGRFGQLRQSVLAAAPALSWEQDATALVAVYRRLADRPVRPGDRHTPPPDAPAPA